MTQTNPWQRQNQEQDGRIPPPSFGARPGPIPNASLPTTAQAESVAAWLRWHAVELAGLGVPLVLALLVSVWFVALAIPAAGLWAINEARQTRHRTLRAGERTALTSSYSREEIDR